MPGTAARTFACAAELLARFLKLRYDGIAIASRIPRMMMTTSSSIRVKPLSSEAMRFRRVLVMRSGSFQGGMGGVCQIGLARAPVEPRTGERNPIHLPSSAGLQLPMTRSESHAADPFGNRRAARAD